MEINSFYTFHLKFSLFYRIPFWGFPSPQLAPLPNTISLIGKISKFQDWWADDIETLVTTDTYESVYKWTVLLYEVIPMPSSGEKERSSDTTFLGESFQNTVFLQWEKAESLPTKICNKTRMPTLTTFIQHNIKSPSHSNQTSKRNKRYLIWKRRVKIFCICRWHDTIYRKL